MKFVKYLFFGLVFILTSCIEIIEDLKINKDGSGTFKYTINLSSNKVKVATALTLDSLDGYKLPKKHEIKEKISELKIKLSKQEGISKVIVTEDYENFIIKLQCDFTNVEKLESALKVIFTNQNESSVYQYDWISLDNKTLTRQTPIFSIDEIKKFGSYDIENLKKGSYSSITRFESEIDKFENVNSTISKSKTALMVRVRPDLFLENENVLDNKITLKK